MNEDDLLYKTTYLQKVVGLLSSLGPLHLCQMWLKPADNCSGLRGGNTARDNFFFLFGAQQRTELKGKGRRGLSQRARETPQEISPV